MNYTLENLQNLSRTSNRPVAGHSSFLPPFNPFKSYPCTNNHQGYLLDVTKQLTQHLGPSLGQESGHKTLLLAEFSCDTKTPLFSLHLLPPCFLANMTHPIAPPHHP